ncbi:hypothetical protein LV779_14195 [Streptomyces thinghirensis]|nr:hypothetical protein [Streptomyces thinghirensis]
MAGARGRFRGHRAHPGLARHLRGSGVAPEKLGDYLRRLRALFEEFGYLESRPSRRPLRGGLRTPGSPFDLRPPRTGWRRTGGS